MIIKNSHFVITGGNRGIGYAVAEMAARSGAHVYIAARSLDSHKQQRLKELGAASVQFLKCDLVTRDGVENLSKLIKNIDVDILFNNAGLLTGGLVEEQSLDDIYSMLQVNVNAVIHLTHSIIPQMIKRGKGKIINNASVSAFMHFPCASTYAAAKAAVVAFTNCIEAELKGTGASTLCLVTPGVKTRMFDEIETKYAKNFEVPQDYISSDEYALQIKAAIESDSRYLFPKGATAIGLWVARHLNPIFCKVVAKKFKR